MFSCIGLSYSNFGCCSAKARLSKKAKTSGHTDDVDPEKTPENEGENPEIATDHSAPQNPGADANPPEVEPDVHVDTSHPHAPPSPIAEQRDSTVDPPSPVNRPPSPAAKAPSPVKNVNPSSPAKDDDVVVTGTAYTAPGNPVALSKHTAKDEFAAMSKGKGKTDLSAYVDLSAQDLHSGFLNRLYTSRDYEAGLVNLMKERYEVNSFALCSVPSLHCSPQGPVCLLESQTGTLYIPYCTLLIFLVYF